jgi:hypothetical protein
MIAAEARLAAPIATLEAQLVAHREALTQLTSGWHGDSADGRWCAPRRTCNGNGSFASGF